MPPTTGVFEEHIERVRVQSRVWCRATVMWPTQTWLQSGRQRSHTTSTVAALCAIVELVRGHCKASNSTHGCSCRRIDLPWADLCSCRTHWENDTDCIVNL